MKTGWIMLNVALLACSGGADNNINPSGATALSGGASAPLTPQPSTAGAANTSGAETRALPAAPLGAKPAGAPATPSVDPPAVGAPAMDAGMQPAMAPGMQPQVDAGATTPTKPRSSGPVNGDPNAPVVELADVPCRSASQLSGVRAGGSSINAEIDGRELAIDYPCGKHEGAQMTVILNLHGTLISGASFLYQRSYFSAFRFADSHNLIVIHPQSASTTSYGAQWGNDDGGTDLPHLIAVMTWVYERFAKFDIRSTWIAGHSWGAVYAEGAYDRPGFVCDEKFKDQFKGVLGLSYIAPPPCAERVSMIGTQGEEEDFEQLDQGSIAQMHGCDPMMKGPEKVGNNERYYWDGCDPGWIHEDWLMLGKGHIDPMDTEVVQKIVERIKSTES